MSSILNNEEAFKYLFAEARRATYKTWIFDKKVGANCTSENLAKAGFIKTEKDATICVFCEKELVWDNPVDDPLKEHAIHSDKCPFLPLMTIPENEWKTDDKNVVEVLATLAALVQVKKIRIYQNECNVAYKKAISKLTPYLPSENEKK